MTARQGAAAPYTNLLQQCGVGGGVGGGGGNCLRTQVTSCVVSPDSVAWFRWVGRRVHLSVDSSIGSLLPVALQPPATALAPCTNHRTQDREIGRVVLKLAGPTPASSSLRLPRRREESLGATGRYLYLQLRLVPGKPYAVHAELATADRGLHRLSVSNLGGGWEGARAQRSGVQVRSGGRMGTGGMP